VIRKDVEFIENEAWDGMINSTTTILVTIALEDEEVSEDRILNFF
jgi:hypothetical protein